MRSKMQLVVTTSFYILEDKMVVMGRQMYLPDDKTLKDEALKEVHESRFAILLKSTKMYRDLKEFYWGPNIKKKMVEYVAKCCVSTSESGASEADEAFTTTFDT